MNEHKKGIMYIAFGTEYVRDAIKSAKSLKRHNDSFGTTLICDEIVENDVFDRVNVVSDDNNNWGSNSHPKMYYLQDSPYQQTLYLDNDTLVLSDLSPVFNLLDRFDIGAAHAPVRQYETEDKYPVEHVPPSFPEYNSGVVIYDNNSKINGFFDSWVRNYERLSAEGVRVDQPSFRKSLYESNVSIATLPSEYNCRTVKSGYVQEEVKIVHGSNKNLAKVGRRLNKRAGTPRTFTTTSTGGCLRVHRYPNIFCEYLSKLSLVYRSLKKNGVSTTIKKIVQRLKRK